MNENLKDNESGILADVKNQNFIETFGSNQASPKWAMHKPKMISTLQDSAPFEYRIYSRYSFPRSPHAIEQIPSSQSQVQDNVRKINTNIDQLSSIISEVTDEKLASMEEVKKITESFRSPVK